MYLQMRARWGWCASYDKWCEVEINALTNELIMKGVAFAYPGGDLVLKRVNVTFPKGIYRSVWRKWLRAQAEAEASHNARFVVQNKDDI